ncbi:MAG: hypothetical protein ACFCU1_04975 [Sumerlaeia bacterium]
MGWIILFVLSIVLLGGMIAVFYSVAKESDTQYKDTAFTNNQVRLFFWIVAILLCVLAAGVEYVLVVR